MKGFTVLELMVALVISAIALGLALPSLQKFNRTQQMKSAVRTLHHDLAAGRSEAILRNGAVIACPGSPAVGCSESTDWSGNWILFADENADAKFQAGETILRHGQGFKHLKITFSPGRTRLRFSSDGSAPGSNGSLIFCGLGGPPEAKKLVISNVGRIRRDTAPATGADYCP